MGPCQLRRHCGDFERAGDAHHRFHLAGVVARSDDGEMAANGFGLPFFEGCQHAERTESPRVRMRDPCGKVATWFLVPDWPGVTVSSCTRGRSVQTKCPSFSRLVLRYLELCGLGLTRMGTCSTISKP